MKNTATAEVMAVKFTYALEAFGGFWIAYADRTTEYVTVTKCPATVPNVVRDAAMRNAGMWQKTRRFNESEMNAWNQWALV